MGKVANVITSPKIKSSPIRSCFCLSIHAKIIPYNLIFKNMAKKLRKKYKNQNPILIIPVDDFNKDKLGDHVARQNPVDLSAEKHGDSECRCTIRIHCKRRANVLMNFWRSLRRWFNSGHETGYIFC